MYKRGDIILWYDERKMTVYAIDIVVGQSYVNNYEIILEEIRDDERLMRLNFKGDTGPSILGLSWEE